jgi:hypothetical protein
MITQNWNPQRILAIQIKGDSTFLKLYSQTKTAEAQFGFEGR